MKKFTILIFFMFVAFIFVGCSHMQEKTEISAIPPQKIIIEFKTSGDQPINVTAGVDKIVKSMEVSNPEGKLSGLSFASKDKAFMKLFSHLSIADCTNLWNDFIVLENNFNIRDVNLFINSSGGDVFAGLAIADQIERAKRKGFKITAYASGIIASAAVPIFAVCDTRLAAPGTIFMVHEIALWKWQARETASDIRSQDEQLKILRERYIGKLADNSKLAREKWEEFGNKTTWFSAEEAKEWGLVDKVE